MRSTCYKINTKVFEKPFVKKKILKRNNEIWTSFLPFLILSYISEVSYPQRGPTPLLKFLKWHQNLQNINIIRQQQKD